MRFLRRRMPLHRQLAEAGGLADGLRTPAPAAQLPGWDGEPRGEAGIHGVPRARRWDTVAAAQAPDAIGDAIRFVALPDGTLVLDDSPAEGAAGTPQRQSPEQPAQALAPLADAVEASIRPPYRAEAVRRDDGSWAVGASRIVLMEAPGLDGEEAELVASREGRTLRVDGQERFGSVPAFEQAGAAEGAEYVVRARRVDGDLWEIEATAL